MLVSLVQSSIFGSILDVRLPFPLVIGGRASDTLAFPRTAIPAACTCSRSACVVVNAATQPSLVSTCVGYRSGSSLNGRSQESTLVATERIEAMNNGLCVPYQPPTWTEQLHSQPTKRCKLGLLPTPIQKWNIPDLPKGTELWIKRDDLTGMQLSGNKVRKLEFLLADAMDKGCDCVVTIGGIQSNHCRATTVAARYMGMESHLILRNNKVAAEQDPGLVGNLLVERLLGAHIHQVTKQEYQQHGSEALLQHLTRELLAKGKKPYPIVVGGSDSLGTWGYIQMIQELEEQMLKGEGPTVLNDIVMACGSGGTTAGIALGVHLSGLHAKVHAYGVCDSPTYFYNYINGLYNGLGLSKKIDAKNLLSVIDAKGGGYAISRTEELDCVLKVAQNTGIILDPVYTGKALGGLLHDMRAQPELWEGRKVLFVHTGGLLGMYDKEVQLQPLLEGLGRSSRLDVSNI
mmetsp:Transcript_10269/g.62922  ORF Transcript_10269/g.62922 Transcript_10269/m.62922 type:complete len:460 (-) Transcript_10269:734-2113(-)